MIGLPEIVAGVMAMALTAYVLTGGADFGGGVWDLFATGPRSDRQRELITASIAPIWEANHVWLIVVVVVLFTAFPAAFSMLATVLHIPLTLMLVGIVMRGSAFVFRSYGTKRRNAWGTAFAIASVMTPLFLGIVIGAIANGSVAAAAANVEHGPFVDVFVRPWLAPFPVVVGLLALSVFAFLAATYLTVDASDEPLRDDFRMRALLAAAAVFVFAAAARINVAAVIEGAALLAALAAVAALWRRQYRLARILAAAEVTFILWGWLAAQYPFVIPPVLTIRRAAAPGITLELLAVGLAAGGILLLPSLHYLLRTFTFARSRERGD